MSDTRINKNRSPKGTNKKFNEEGLLKKKVSTRPRVPVVVVILSSVLLSCNFLWLYSTKNGFSKGICDHEVEVWGAGNITKSNLDYQKVQGSGLKEVLVPIQIPNDTILVGEDQVQYDGENTRFMTIGISSVWRKDDYLHKTLNSILKATSEDEKLDIFIFVLLADADPHKRVERAKEIEKKYSKQIESNLIRVLQPPISLYPSIDFSKIRRTYNDPLDRVQWRTKQALDFAFLFWYTYTRQPSTYYLILEDDILSANHFVSATKDFVQFHNNHYWVTLQMAGFLSIGRLLRCQDLDRLARFIIMFYREHPVDILINYWVKLMVPDKPSKDRPVRRVPGLFQHIGVHSTLANKTQPHKDNTFSLVKRRFSHVNPSADIVTTISHYKSFVAELAYSSAPGMFWGSPKNEDTFDIIFPQPIRIQRIYISTGTSVHNKNKATKLRDKLTHGHVEVSGKFMQMENQFKANCKNFEYLKSFTNGNMDYKTLTDLFPEGIQCIRIVVDQKQKTWVAISEIAVFTMDKETV